MIPTSNHNCKGKSYGAVGLYIFWFLHQTTTYRILSNGKDRLYIFWFLHQTTTFRLNWKRQFCCISFDSYIKPQREHEPIVKIARCISFDSYIKPQLLAILTMSDYSCISFDSYIKPQLKLRNRFIHVVVYLLIPTSNHNLLMRLPTTSLLYIFWFLHQTTTVVSVLSVNVSCISFDSYIKPQLPAGAECQQSVVYLLIPTSNHNWFASSSISPKVVYLLIPTSNHNSIILGLI